MSVKRWGFDDPPRFKDGEPLTAAKLNWILERLDALEQKVNLIAPPLPRKAERNA